MPHNRKKRTITIMMTSDLHGNVLPYEYGSHQPTNKGFAKIAEILQTLCKANPHHILIDNGDLIQGNALTYHQARIDSTLPHPLVACLNQLHYDAAVLGNHEFNYGQDVLRKVIAESTFPWLCANICMKDTDEPAFGTPYIVKSFDGDLRIGILGLTTKYIPYWEREQNIQGLTFLDPVETGKKWTAFLRDQENVDVVVIAYHGGIERDISTGIPIEKQTGENQGYQMCMEIEGLDVLLTGHQHQGIIGSVHGVTVAQTENDGQSIAKITLSLEKENGTWFITDKVGMLISASDTEPDKEIIQLIQPYEEKTQKWLNQPIGRVVGDMRVKSPMMIRLKDNPLIEFINQVQMYYGGTTISCTPLLSDDCPGFMGTVTMRDVIATYKYPNTLRVLRVKGIRIKEALEISASFFELKEGNKIAVSPSFSKPKPQFYNYDMWEGIEYVLDISRPIGERVISLSRGGIPLNLQDEYEVAMNNYRAVGGGSYHMFRQCEVVREVLIDVSELIANYFMERESVVATCNHNWYVIVPEPI